MNHCPKELILRGGNFIFWKAIKEKVPAFSRPARHKEERFN